VIASSGGYPGPFETGREIGGLGEAAKVEGVQVFHSGTRLEGDKLLTNAGRVLGVTAAGGTLEDALARAYEAIGKIEFEGIYYRRDIAHRALSKAKAGALAQAEGKLRV
jgi:phosphoribosylamine--glycine ligase